MDLKKDIAISESGFIFDSTTGDSFTVNSTGLEILNYFKENKSKEEIKKILLDKYDLDDATFEKCFMDFSNMLKYFNLM